MNKITNYILIGVIAIAGIVLIYTNQKKSEEPQDVPVKKELTDVTVMMPFTPQPLWAQFYCAVDQGYYDEVGLNVDITYTTFGTMDSLKQLAANNVDFAYGGDESLIIARSQNIPIVAIQKAIHHNLLDVFSKTEKDINEPKDLIGKKVAMPSAGATVTFLTKAMLYKAGLDYNDVEFVFVGAALIPALLQNNVDAIGGYVPHKIILENMGQETKVLHTIDYTTLGKIYVFTNEKMIQENPDIVKKFTTATQKGLEFAIKYPEKATDIYLKFNPDATKNRDVSLAIWKDLSERGFSKTPKGEIIYEKPSEDDWTEKQNTLYEIGVIDKKTDVNKMFTDEFIKIE